MVTPVNVGHLVKLLRESGYDENEILFLENGLTNGFDIGYDGPQVRQSNSENLPFTVGDRTELWNKLMKEVKLKRVAGPFKTIPFDNFIQSPIGLIPKDNGTQTRLVFHLSYDCKRDGHKSLNHHTPREVCTVKYKDLDYAIQAYLCVCETAEMEELSQTSELNDMHEKTTVTRLSQKEMEKQI